MEKNILEVPGTNADHHHTETKEILALVSGIKMFHSSLEDELSLNCSYSIQTLLDADSKKP